MKRELNRLKEKFEHYMSFMFPKDPLAFFEQNLGFKPTEYQVQLTKSFTENQFVAARWCRQSGKSHIISALLLHYALIHPDTYIAVVGPSWRQTKLIIRRINSFLRKLPKGSYHRPQKTIVRLSNGSVIEAFPNNPETIRGPSLHVVFCDEMSFIQNDEELYDAILFTLSATNGKFICSSTPWSTDSIFYKIFNHEDYADFKRSHITWRDAVEPEGPLKKATLEKIQRQFQGDPWRWKREMEAEWAENESVWLPQALITSCIDHTLCYIDFNERAKGEFFTGIDLGKHQDHSVISVVMREKNLLKLVHLKRFPLKTAYASVIGYVKTLCDRWSSIQKVSVDMSGVGDYIVEDMQNAGIHGVQGIKFTQPTKEQLATNLKQQMVEGVFKIPYDPDLIAELNVERFELRKTGGISFNHPEGTHDDKFWSVALALHSSRVETPSQLVRAY